MSNITPIKANNNSNFDRQLINLFDPADEAWQDHSKAQEFLDFINPVPTLDGENTHLDTKTAKVLERKLPFYKEDVTMIKVEGRHPDDELFLFYLLCGEDLVPLGGISDPIFEINDLGMLDLNQDNVFDYLKFFCAFIDSEEDGEPFYVIEGEQSEFLKDWSKHQQSRALRKYNGPVIISSTDKKNFRVESRVLHCGYLFDSKFKVTPDGEVEMTDDNAIGSM